MNKFKCILFDLDGTLIDTNPLIIESFRHAFRYHFNDIKEDSEIIKFLGLPLKKPFEDLYPGMEDMLIKTYREFNEARHDGFIGIFIGILSVLQELADKGIVLGIVTSKRRKMALRGMQLFGLEKFMSVLITMEDTITHKPEAEPVLKALEVLKIEDRLSVLYVGDSPYDILCAKNAGVKGCAVSWSYMTAEELQNVEPDIFIEKPRDLLKYI